jgi:WD40 repeat protein
VSTSRGGPRQGAFISYARADGESAARTLHARLQADAPDVRAWLDRYEIEGGVGWWNQIEEALDRAEFLLLVMTPAAMQSENTRREWRSARQRGVCVYPIKGAPDGALDFPALPNWMRKAHFYDPQLEWQKLLAHLRRGCGATRVPFMAPSLPAGFVARPAPASAVAASLLHAPGDGRRTLVALRGPGGFGKTTLAAATCYDERIVDAFDDGILWVTLGQSPNLLNELIKLYAALTGERPGFVDVEDASRELALKLENRSCLLVIDDVWNTAHLRPFLEGGAGCARLITTRLLDATADAHRIEIEQMTRAEAVQMLLARAGIATAAPERVRELVERLGEWPLPIKLAASAMRQRMDRGDTAESALDYVDRALDKRGITAFDKRDGTDRGDAVGRTIAASLDLLAPDEQRRCADLSVFPEDAPTSVATAARLWDLDELDAEDLARKLDDLALIEFDLRRDTIRMHDVLRGLLLARLPDRAAVHARLVDAWGDPHHLPDADAWRGYAYHLVHAGRTADLRRLLLDPAWLDARVRATDVTSLVGDFNHLADDPVAGLVRDALRLSAPAIARDPGQLETQLLGRLHGRPEPDVRQLYARWAHGRGERPWLQLMGPTLDGPGGMLRMTLVGHAGEITSLAADTAFRTVTSASEDGTVRVWDVETGALLRTFEHRRLGVWAVASTSDGGTALSAGADGMLYQWQVAAGPSGSPVSAASKLARTALALSADGSTAVWGSRCPEVIAWDVRRCQVLHVLQGHEEGVTSVGISADGTRAVSGSDDGTLRVWDLTTGALVRTLRGHSAPVNAVALSTDGRHALSGSTDRTIRVWDADDGSCARTLIGHDGSVTSVALASKGRRAISGSSDRRAMLWNLEDGTALATLEGHSDVVGAVAIDETGMQAATGSVDRTIKLWRLDVLRSPARGETHAGAVVSLVFSGDGSRCASGGDDGRVTVREVETGAIVRSFDAHVCPVRSLAFTHDNQCILSAGIDRRFWLWTIDDGTAVSIPMRHWGPVDDCAFSAAARYLVSACGDQFVYLWDVPSGVLIERYGTRRLFDHLIPPSPRRRTLPDSDELRDRYLPGEAVHDVALVRMSADGDYALLSAVVRESAGGLRADSAAPVAHKSCVLAFHVPTGEIRTFTSRQTEPISAFAIHPGTGRLLWGRADRGIAVCDLRSEKRVAILRGHEDEVNAVGFSGDGRLAYSCARDRNLIVWDLESGERLAAFTADAALRSLAVSPAGNAVAAGDVAGRVHFLRLVRAPGSA